MEIMVFDVNRQLAGVVENYDCFRWTRRYSTAGSFELKAIGTSENAALLSIGNWVWKSDDQEIGMIEQVQMRQTDAEFITASGRFATGLLSRRILWNTETLDGDLGVCVGQLINNHLISPTDAARRVPFLTFSAPSFGIPVKGQVSYRNLGDVVAEMLDAADVGVRTVFHPATGGLAMSLYQGEAVPAVFSRHYENLVSQDFIQSVSDYADTALIGGEGEGADRTFAAIIGSGTGVERRERFVDADDLRSEDFPDGYTDALLYRGHEKLAEHAMVNALDAEINPRGNLAYKTDYDLGQVVTVQARKWGVSMAARITEVTESYDAGGLSLDVTFGKGLLTLAQKLHQNTQGV